MLKYFGRVQRLGGQAHGVGGSASAMAHHGMEQAQPARCRPQWQCIAQARQGHATGARLLQVQGIRQSLQRLRAWYQRPDVRREAHQCPDGTPGLRPEVIARKHPFAVPMLPFATVQYQLPAAQIGLTPLPGQGFARGKQAAGGTQDVRFLLQGGPV